ncbi:MAG: crosslink repair DNA glycosylase YcaQ family protein, partial [Gemmatimonadaceae bacterium]
MTVTVRELNRATLARQMLLERHAVTPLEATERLVGLQAQLARPPFVGLWSRVRGFERDQLLGLVRDRQVVRATAMRGTLHLLSARDFVRFRATLQPV